MNAIFLQMSSTRKNHNPKMTKTLETNITSDKGEEKSQNITYLLLSNNATIKKDKNSLYLLQYQKYFMKKSFPKGTKASNPSVNIHCLNTDYHPHRYWRRHPTWDTRRLPR